MLRFLTHLILIAVAGGSPIWCQIGGMKPGACDAHCARPSESRDCACCGNSVDGGAPLSSPRPADRRPPAPGECPAGGLCQCLYTGAVLVKPKADLVPQAARAMDDAAPAVVSGFSERHVFTPPSDKPPPHGKANPGRLIRCRCMSFLC